VQFETYPFEKLTALLADITPNGAYTPLTLTIGEPQFATPDFIQRTLQTASPLLNKYPKTAGEAELREAQRGFVKRRFHIELDDTQIIPTFGTRELLFNFPQFLLAKRPDPVMAFTNPFYQIYEGAAIAAKAKVLHLNLTPQNGFLPEINEARLAECDLVILNFPNNPTASVMPLETMTEWVRLALKHDFVLLNDECYSEIYTHTPPPSILQASIKAGNPRFKNILAINSVSKRSSAPGLRSGFIAGDERILKSYLRYRTYVGCASPLPLQKAAAAAWNDEDHVEIFRQKYRQNFQIAAEILEVPVPEATFYIWLAVDDELAFTRRLYAEYNLKVLPGSFLGREGIGQGFVRIALVESTEKTVEACHRIRDCLKG